MVKYSSVPFFSVQLLAMLVGIQNNLMAENGNNLDLSLLYKIHDDSFQNYQSSINNDLNVPEQKYFFEMQRASDVYKKVHKGVEIDQRRYINFLDKIKGIFDIASPKIILQNDSLKVKFEYNGKSFIIDYDYGIDDSVFVTEDGLSGMNVKECSADDVMETVGDYFENVSGGIITAA